MCVSNYYYAHFFNVGKEDRKKGKIGRVALWQCKKQYTNKMEKNWIKKWAVLFTSCMQTSYMTGETLSVLQSWAQFPTCTIKSVESYPIYTMSFCGSHIWIVYWSHLTTCVQMCIWSDCNQKAVLCVNMQIKLLCLNTQFHCS